MPVMDEFKELQQGEMEVLRSIYGDDFESVETRTAWKSVNAAHEFRVRVRPVEEPLKEIVNVKIHFKLPLRYPKQAPTFTLDEPVGLETNHLNALRTLLQRESTTTLLGSEMIYELCSIAATFITDRHTDMNKNSLEDQRKLRSQEEEKANREALKRAEAQKQREQAAEAARMAQLISGDVKRKEELRAERDRQEKLKEREGIEGESLQVGEGGERKIKMSISTDGHGPKEVVAKLGMPSDWIGRMLPVELMMGMEAALSANAYVIDVLGPYYLTPQGKRKLSKLDTDLTRARALRHPNILSLYGSVLARYTPSFFPDNPSAQPLLRTTAGWSLIVLHEQVPTAAQTLEYLLATVGELKLDKAITCLQQLVAAVEYLHLSNVTHRSIRPKAIWVCNERSPVGNSTVSIKLGNVAWFQRIIDLNKAEPWVAAPSQDDLPESWMCPEVVDDPFAYDRSRDMWDVGIVFAQMVFGTDVHHRWASPADLLQSIPRNSSPVLRKVLSDLLLTEAKKRPTAARLSAQLLELSGSGVAHDRGVSLPPMILSTTPTNTVAAWPNKARGPGTPMFSPGVGSKESQMAESSQVGFFWQPRPTGSRYRSEFEELEFLGRGGGGQVVKARNRLDGHLYAVKKIRLPTDKQAEIKILREVTIWSRMNHPNIVRYHTAWTETEDVSQSSYVIDGEESTQSTADISAPSTEWVSTANEATGDSNSDDDSDAVDFDSDDSDPAATPGHDLDIDLGLDDLDDVDFLFAGHSKSVSYPSIHFGNEDDASTDDRTSPAVSRHSKHSTKYNSPAIPATPKQTRTLYIQMEYVEKLTLREAIEEGLSEIASWRFMNQILSAMLHFTSLNIIHRDLKPSNIFIDGKEDVRIGDFGLAVNQGGVLDSTDGLLSMDSSMDESDFTSGVGTSLYIAPETLSRTRTERSIKYSNKIDMYSLGVVFFEMFHGPFKTGMERIHVLRRLREPEIRFPPSWDMVRLAQHTKIVQTCLQHDPEKRASPKDLLASDLLPPRVGDDSIEETIRLLSHSGTTHAQTLITALFNQTVEDRIRKDFSYDFYDGEGAKVDNDPYAELVRDKLSRIFRQKGAVSMDSPLLMPHSNIYGARDPVRLLDSDGTVTCLPFHLNIPFCRMVARDTSLTRLKRWTIAPVYRHTKAGGVRHARAGGFILQKLTQLIYHLPRTLQQPRAVLNAAFDIVTDAVTAATEAEILIVVEEILAAFPLTGQKVHVLNHSKLLDAVVDRVPEKQREAVLEVLQQHGRLQRSWVKTSSELLKIPGVTKPMCDEFGLLNTSGTLAEVRALVVASPRLKHVVQEGFDELQEILNFSQQLGIKNIKISPLLATNWDFHRDGVLFETHHIRGKMREVVAAGGRFDEVVLRLAAPEVRYSGRVPHVVGVSISVAKLSQAAADANAAASKSLMNRRDESTRSYGPWSVRRCDVYVVSFVANLIEARWDVVKDLWKAGIKADLMYDDDLLSLTPEQLQSACRREGVMWIVIVKPGQATTAHGRHALDDAERTLKVKSVLLPRSELTSFLSKEMREQQTADESSNEAFDVGGSLAEQAKSLQDIYPILADDDIRQKGRAKQKSMIASRAQKSVEQAAQAAAEAPVFAVDVDGQAYRKMCESAAWVDDDEAYRSVIQHAPNTKRVYIASIRQQIRKHKAASSTPLPSFWLFSLREDRSVLLTCDGV